MKQAFKMKLNPQMKDEYRKRHQNVDPELEKLFKLAKVSSYSIWYDNETNYLFGYVELEDIKVWEDIANNKACQKWWDFMQDIMQTNADNSPVSNDLEQVYDFKGAK